MELKELMRNAGILGAGGAGFPSYAKLAEGADTLLINGAECEPLIYTDYVIMKREMSTVLTGIRTVLDAYSIPRAVLSIKDHTAKRLSLSDGDSLADKISVKVLPDVYPIGDEIGLIYESLGRVVRPGALPITKGVIVYNVETMYNLGRYARLGECVTMKWLTVGGNTDKGCVVRVPVGISVRELLNTLGIIIPEGHAVIDGGPSMGKVVNPSTHVITKTTKAILILPETTPAVLSKKMSEKMAVARAETACCQCTRCTDMCPRALLGYPLEPHKMVRTAMGAVTFRPELVISATLCCGCGICESIACSQGISPKAVINNYKALLSKNKMRYSQNTDVEAKKERAYRMVSSERWESTIGVKKYDTPLDFERELAEARRVEILLGSHIGAPSSAVVRDGDRVERGQLIAEAREGLSLPQYASISGRVTLLGDRIVIDS